MLIEFPVVPLTTKLVEDFPEATATPATFTLDVELLAVGVTTTFGTEYGTATV
jgi:hypothetical protein